jgi:hypothetical protein
MRTKSLLVLFFGARVARKVTFRKTMFMRCLMFLF